MRSRSATLPPNRATHTQQATRSGAAAALSPRSHTPHNHKDHARNSDIERSQRSADFHTPPRHRTSSPQPPLLPLQCRRLSAARSAANPHCRVPQTAPNGHDQQSANSDTQAVQRSTRIGRRVCGQFRRRFACAAAARGVGVARTTAPRRPHQRHSDTTKSGRHTTTHTPHTRAHNHNSTGAHIHTAHTRRGRW